MLRVTSAVTRGSEGLDVGPELDDSTEGVSDSLAYTAGNILVNIIGGQSIDLVNPTTNLNYIKEEYGSKKRIAEKAKEALYTTKGMAIAYAGGIAVALEQSPINENWRVSQAIKTLIATLNPVEVARKVAELTAYIELGAAALVLMAVFSTNRVVARPREAAYRWAEMGAKREEYRTSLKDEEDRVGNNWRRAQYKKVKGLPKAEKKAINENTRRKKLEEVVNPRRATRLKAPKETKLQKKEIKTQEKLHQLQIRNNWRRANGKKDKLPRVQKKLNKIEQRIQNAQAENNWRRANGKKDKLGLAPRISRRTAKELNDLGIALGLGAGIVVFNNGVKNRSYRVMDGLIDAVKASLEISAVSSFIGYIIAAGTEKAKLGVPMTDHTIHFEKQAQWVVDYGTDTKFIVGTLLLAQSPSILKKLRYRLPDKERGFKKWLIEKETAEAQESSDSVVLI